MAIKKLCHIHIYVKDIKEASKRLADVMGTKWMGTLPVPPFNLQVAFDNIGLELWSLTSEDSPFMKYVPAGGQGIYSIGLQVSNIEQTVADMQAKGVEFIDLLPKTHPGQKVFVGNDCIKGAMTVPNSLFGVMFELIEYPEWPTVVLANLNRLTNIKAPWEIGAKWEADLTHGRSYM